PEERVLGRRHPVPHPRGAADLHDEGGDAHVTDEAFALLVQRYAEGDLDATERQALTEAVLADGARQAQFARQVRLSLELGALFQEEDGEDARLRASLIVSEDADARDRRVMDSLEKRLRIGAWKAEAERERRRSTR